MNRTDLQLLADTRVADAQVLFHASRWAAAYYLLGYAVECAIKACIAKQFRQDEVPEKRSVEQFYTHKLEQLLQHDSVKAAFQAKAAADRVFRVNWNTVKDWDPVVRYKHSMAEIKARDMLSAVTDSISGVLPWLKTQW